MVISSPGFRALVPPRFNARAANARRITASPPRFGAQNAGNGDDNTIIGGMIPWHFIRDAARRWDQQTRGALRPYLTQDIQNPIILKILQPFGITQWHGIPPLMVADPDGHPTTTGAFGILTLEILKKLPPAHNTADAAGQIFETVGHLALWGQGGYQRFLTAGTPPVQVKPALFTAVGPPIQPLQGLIYNTVQTGHLVFIGDNGAIRMLQVPDPRTMADIIRHDPAAQQAIEAKQPLTHRKKTQNLDPVFTNRSGTIYSSPTEDPDNIPKEHGAGLKATLRLLDGIAGGNWTNRRSPHNETDIHDLIETVPIDWERHIKEGRVKILFDKPGADGRLVRIPAPRKMDVAA